MQDLIEIHKAERRARILAAARKLIAKDGFAGLTMRGLATASRLSVPTVYSLVGGRDAVLVALIEAMVLRSAEHVPAAGDASFVERALALCEAGHRELLDAPAYSRELVHLFLTSEEASPLRRAIDERSIEAMANILRDGQRAGQLASWVDAQNVSRCMWAQYTMTTIGWAVGELDDRGLRSQARLGFGLMLLGLARGRARDELEKIVRRATSANSTEESARPTGRAAKRRRP